MKGKQKTGVHTHTPVRIKFSPSVGVPPTDVPRRCCNAGYSAQHHGQDQYNHSHKNTSRENHVVELKTKGATAAVNARKNLGHTSECGDRNTPFDRISIGERKSDITHTSCISKFYPTFRV